MVLDQAKLVEIGIHEELLRNNTGTFCTKQNKCSKSISFAVDMADCRSVLCITAIAFDIFGLESVYELN